MRVWGRGGSTAVVATVLLALGAAATPALAAKPKSLTLSSFKLKGSNGYRIEAISLHEGSASNVSEISARRGSLSASYQTPSEPGPGMHAEFGALGSLDLDFHREKRRVDQFGKRCKVITETGIFRGRFGFSGESGYTSAEAEAVSGEVTRFPDGLCFLEDFRRASASSAPPFLQVTSLMARSRTANGSIELKASEMKVGRDPILSVRVKEKTGAIKIVRSAVAGLAKHDLVFGPGKPPRSADLEPPSPFTGSAHFEDPARGPSTWTGSLTISLPGAPAVAFAGPEFAARICLDKSLLSGCKVDLPPGKGQPEPEL